MAATFEILKSDIFKSLIEISKGDMSTFTETTNELLEFSKTMSYNFPIENKRSQAEENNKNYISTANGNDW